MREREDFVYIHPFIEDEGRLKFNREYAEAKFKGWIFRGENGKFYFQIRGIDDPPESDCVLKELWPAKFKLSNA